MPQYYAPDVYVEEVRSTVRPISAVGMSTAAFLGVAPLADRHLQDAILIANWSQFVREYCGENPSSTPLSQAVYGFFANGGGRCYVTNVGDAKSLAGRANKREGLRILEEIDDVAVVAAPGYTASADYQAILDHCDARGDRFALLDSPENVERLDALTRFGGESAEGALRPPPNAKGNAAFYFPWIRVTDPFEPDKGLVSVAPSGHIAGVYARTDAQRGVHKAPANEPIRGAVEVTRRVTREEQELLNPEGINVIRFFPRRGILIWGARTVAPTDKADYRYVNVRRLVTMIKQSIREGTGWVVFEPNDQTLWKSIRRDIGAFLTGLWRDGALMGATPEQAFFVKCDEETNPPDVVDAGRVVTEIGIAPVKPAEFIVFRIGQSLGEVRETA